MAAASLPLAALARRVEAAGFGELVSDPNGMLDLPRGFSYRILQQRGQSMSDGVRLPGKMDGMACFDGPNDTYILLRNHELNSGHAEIERAFPLDAPWPARSYYTQHPGGVTRVVIDRHTLEEQSSNLVLYGTMMNCAGGKSPWGWISCEEIFDAEENDLTSPHGYAFLCHPSHDSLAPPFPIRGYGRFRHEAAVVDPETHVCYLTEDRPDGCFYRFVPYRKQTPFEGVLQALKVRGAVNLATSTALQVAVPVETEWVTIDDPEARGALVRTQAKARGAAVVVRGEGIAEHQGQIYLCATTGGAAGRGQIMRYVPSQAERALDATSGGNLELVLESTSAELVNQPDNIVVAPWGDVYMCEDNLDGVIHLQVLTQSGRVFRFAKNALSASELAGVCFSPDGRAMFVNLQHDGYTLAITGPFGSADDFEPIAPAVLLDASTAGQSIDANASDAGVASNGVDGVESPPVAVAEFPDPDGLRSRGGCQISASEDSNAARIGGSVLGAAVTAHVARRRSARSR